jgi:predicted nucleic acid-binding protein
MSARGITLDTGALIAIQRSEKRMRTLLDEVRRADVPVVVPAVVLIEWWRGQNTRGSKGQGSFLQGLVIEPTSEQIAKAAGEAIATVPNASSVDAAVMASAALRGDGEGLVYTSDVGDLERLRRHFPGVRVLRATGQ